MFEYIHHVAYVVSDIDHAVRVFRDTFELELTERRVVEPEPGYDGHDRGQHDEVGDAQELAALQAEEEVVGRHREHGSR